MRDSVAGLHEQAQEEIAGLRNTAEHVADRMRREAEEESDRVRADAYAERERATEDEWYTLSDTEGNPIAVPPGQVWVSLVPTGAGITIEP